MYSVQSMPRPDIKNNLCCSAAIKTIARERERERDIHTHTDRESEQEHKALQNSKLAKPNLRVACSSGCGATQLLQEKADHPSSLDSYLHGVHAKGGRTLQKDVFLPCKHLLSAFYKTLPSKNPSKNLVFTEKNPYKRLLRTLLST